MRLSVLMPVFNTASFLGAALDSICSQTHRDFEIVVVDDGSTDGSTVLLRALAAREPRLKLFVRPNKGLISTRNELVARATGERIAWMDSDDVSEPDRLERQLAALDADPSLICVGTYAQCIDPSGAPLNLETYPTTHSEIVRDQRTGGGIRFPTTMMRREAVLAAGGFREPFVMGEDLDLLLRLGERGQLGNLALVLYRYRQHIASVCATLGSRWIAYRDQILELARQRREDGFDVLQGGGTVVIPAVERHEMKRAAAMTYAYWANCALAQRDRMRALKYAACAVRRDPSARVGWQALAKATSPAGYF